MTKPKSILYLLPVAFFQRFDEPGFQAQTLNFRTAFGFVLPELRKRGMEVTLVSLNNNSKQIVYGKEHLMKLLKTILIWKQTMLMLTLPLCGW